MQEVFNGVDDEESLHTVEITELPEFLQSAEETNKTDKRRGPRRKKTIEEQARDRMVKEIQRFLSEAPQAQIEAFYIQIKSLEIDTKIPGLNPEQKKAFVQMQTGLTFIEE